MCGRFFVEYDDAEIAKIIKEIKRKAKDLLVLDQSRKEIFPGMDTAVLTAGGAKLMNWGYPSRREDGSMLINARSETVDKLPTFKEAFKYRRCLIPAHAYYEWQTSGKQKIKYEFNRPGRELFYLGGIYSNDQRYAVITRAAIPAYHAIHSRMPVIIGAESAETWLFDFGFPFEHSVTELQSRIIDH